MSRTKDPYDFLKWQPRQKFTDEVDDTHVHYRSATRNQILHEFQRLNRQFILHIYHVMTFIIFVTMLAAGLSRIFNR